MPTSHSQPRPSLSNSAAPVRPGYEYTVRDLYLAEDKERPGHIADLTVHADPESLGQPYVPLNQFVAHGGWRLLQILHPDVVREPHLFVGIFERELPHGYPNTPNGKANAG
jgi:hypothetical protein